MTIQTNGWFTTDCRLVFRFDPPPSRLKYADFLVDELDLDGEAQGSLVEPLPLGAGLANPDWQSLIDPALVP